MSGRSSVLVITLIVFVIFTAIAGGLAFMFYMSWEKADSSIRSAMAVELRDVWKNASVRKTLVERKEARDELEAEKIKTKALDDKIKSLEDEKTRLERDVKEARDKRDFLDEKDKRFEAAHKSALTVKTRAIEKLTGQVGEDAKKYRDDTEKMKTEIDELRDLLKEARKTYKENVAKHSKITQKQQQRITELEKERQKFKDIRTVKAQFESDGEVLLIDIKTKLVVVNLGLGDGVKKGMRFEVYREAKGARELKGWIEVKEVKDAVSHAYVLDRTFVYPSCKLCGYMATDRAQRFCPYCSVGAQGTQVQRLEGQAHEVNVGMDKLDPMLKGDIIINRFFEKGKELTFTIAGKLISMSREEMETYIKEHGGKVAEKPSIEVDYLIIGKTTTDDAVSQAKTYGIPIIRERELFDYFGGR